jgi:formate hydrogenlyase subunit 4
MKFIIFFASCWLPFIFLGIVARTKAVWEGRKGAPILQSLYDVHKLLKKSEVVSSTSSLLFRMSPVMQLGCVLFAFLVVPIPGQKALLSIPMDFLLFSYGLALGKFFMVVAAMDTGSSFEGMGASREISFSVLVEPAFFMLLGTFALITEHTSFSSIFPLLQDASSFSVLIQLLALAVLCIMLVVEGSRVPVDDPKTHLELTMIHEVMILDNSGPNLAFALYASGLKMVLIITLMANVIIPHTFTSGVMLVLYAALVCASAVVLGLVESLVARLRMSHVPQFIFIMAALALAAAATVLYCIHGGASCLTS